jgi:SAM-dependent methyltransferase
VAFELNRPAEIAFLEACFRRHARRPVRHVVDLACGTGHHALRLAARGYRITALDLSAPSIAFLAQEARRSALPVTAIVGDMTAFRLPRRADAAICMTDSQGHLLTNEALLAHLRAVRANLRPGGIFVFDRLVPPALGRAPLGWTWTRRRRGVTVRCTFRTLLDWDLARQVCRETMRFEITEGRRRRVVTQQHPTRIVFPQELRVLTELAGGFDLVGLFANFDLRRPLGRSAPASVMVAVLRAR